MEGQMARKDLDEKLAEARRIIEHSDELSPETGGAAFFLLQEVDRLRKIEDGLETLIVMKKQVAESLRDEEAFYKANHLPQSAQFNRDAAGRLMAEVWPLEALLNGE